MKPVKVGTVVKLKNYDALSPLGTVTLVIGEGPTAHYQIHTSEGSVWKFRDQFTIAR